MKPKASLAKSFAISGMLLFAVSFAPAQTVVNWEGDTSTSWATATNWDTAPTNSLTANIANFNLAAYGGSIFAPTVGTATSIAGITIGASNGTMTLTNTAALTIGASGISIANGAGAFTISGSTTLGAAQSWTNNSANLFTFGAVTNGTNLLTIGGSGNTTASGIIGNGAGGLTKEGAGILTLNAANTYTGATTVNGGELRWGINNAIAGGALNVNDGGTVNIQTFTDTVGTVTIAKGGSITGTTGVLTTSSFISDGGGTMTGVTLQLGSTSAGITYNGGAGSITLQIDKVNLNSGTSIHVFDIANGDADVDFEITQALTADGSNVPRTITKTGAGVMQFSGSTANTIGQNQMPLNINEGTVIFNKSAQVNALPNGTITIGDGTGSAGSAILQYRTSNNQIADNTITINSDGLFDLNGLSETTSGALTMNGGSITTGAGTLTLGNNTNTFSGASTATGNLTFTAASGSALNMSGTASINGTTTFSGGNGGGINTTGSTSIAGTLAFGSNSRTIAVTNASDVLTISANTTGSGAITKSGFGTVVLTGSNGYSGGTIVNAGTLQIGNGTTAGTMASTSALTMGGGTFRVLAPTSGNSVQTVASLVTTASTNSIIRITPGASGNTTLTITSATLSTGAGSSLNFDYSAGTTVGGTIGNNYVVWNPTLTAGIIGGAYSVTDSGGIGFATVSGGNVVRLTDPGGAGLPTSTGSATGSYFIGSSYSTDSTSTPGSLVQALSGAVAASNVTVDTTGLASGANLALGTNVLTLGAGMAFNGPNAYEITGSGAGGIRAAASGGTVYLNNGNTSTVTINANILANGASGLTVNGNGTTILGGVNTHSGTTFLNGGTLRLANQLALQNSTLTMGGGTAALVFDSSVAGNAFTFGGLAASTSGAGYNIALQNNATSPAAIALIIGGNNATTTFAGILSGSGSLTKVGTGALTLSGINTYLGGTTLGGGTVNVNSNAALGASGTSITVTGSTTLNSLATVSTEYNRAISLGAGATLTLTHAGTNTADFSGVISGSGNITATNGASSTIALSNTGNTFTGDVLATVSGNGTLRLSFNSIGDGGMLSLGKNSYSVYMQYTGASDLVLDTRRIDLNSSFGNINDGGGNPINMFESNGNGTISFNADMTVAANKTGTFFFGGTNTRDNTYAGVIPNSTGGTLSIGKNGVGKWILSGDNTFTGGVEVRGGTLVLSGTNSYIGQTNVLSGTLVINSIANYDTDSAIGKGTSGQGIILGNAGNTGTLLYTGAAAETNRTFQVNSTNNTNTGGAVIINNGTGSLTFKATTFNNTYTNTQTAHTRTLTLGGTNGGTIEGAIVNSSTTSLVALTKMGLGTWTLAATSSYTGTTTVNGGTLELKDTGSGRTQSYTGLTFGLGDGTLTSNRAGTGTFTTTFTTLTRSAGATGNFISTGGANGSTNILNTTGAAGYMGKGLYYNNSDIAWREGTNGYVRAINYGVDSGTSAVGTVATNTHMKFTSSVTRSAALELSSLHLAGDGVNWTNNSGVSNINGSLIKSGGGTSIISGTGTVGVNSNQELVIHTVASNDILEISSQMVTFGQGLTKSGAGTLILSNANNSFNAPIFINAGTLSVGANIHLGSQTGGQAVNLRGGTLRATGTFGLFNGSAGTNNRNVTLANQSGIEVTGSNTLTIAGVISNNATVGNVDPGFNKTGTGTLLLSGANTYTGTTNVSAGKLLVNNTIGSGTGTGLVNVGVNGTLGGSGTISGATTIAGNLNPGNSPGLLSFGSSLTLETTAVTTMEIDGLVRGTGYDAVNTTSQLSYGGDLILQFATGLASDATFNLFDFGSQTGSFDTVTLAGSYTGSLINDGFGVWSLTSGSDSWTFTQSTGDLTFAVIPEPSVALLGALGVLLLFRRKR